MISNQIMQNTIEGIKAIARVELFVADIDGKLVASTKTTGNSFEGSAQKNKLCIFLSWVKQH